MSESLNKSYLKKLGFEFKKTESENRSRGKMYSNYPFEVVLFKKDKENPVISLLVNNTRVSFPGAYTPKDLKDLLFMFYGEKEYSKRFGN